MGQKTDYISAAREHARRERDELERTIRAERALRYFRRDDGSFRNLFEGMLLLSLMALVPFLAFAGLALWSFGAWSDKGGTPWIFLGLALAIPVFVVIRALKSKSSATSGVLADMVARFWSGVFPILLAGAVVVFALASWLSVSFQAALGLLVLGGIALFALAHQ